MLLLANVLASDCRNQTDCEDNKSKQHKNKMVLVKTEKTYLKLNLNQQSAVKTAHMCVHIIA